MNAVLRRVFFALWPPQAVRERIDALAHAAETRCGGRRMRRDSLHLTLAFIGAVSDEQILSLCQAAQTVRVQPGDFLLDKTGWWPHNHIAWAGCHELPSCLRRLYEALAVALREAGFALDRRPFLPHVTLLRHAHQPPLAPDEPIAWPFDGFALVESRLQPSGARYRMLADWAL